MKKWLSALLAAIMIMMMPLATMEEAIEVVAAPEEDIEVVAAPEEEPEIVEAPVEEDEEEIVAAPAEEEEFVVEDGRLTGYNGTDETVVIPDDVKVIGAWAFAGNHIVTKVVVPASVEAIEDFAFYGCENLEVVSYADDAAIEIGEYAFDGCEKLIAEEPVEVVPAEEEPEVEEIVEEEPVEEITEEEPVEEPAEEITEEEPVEEPVEEEPAEEITEEEPVEEEPAEETTEEEPVEEEPVAEEPAEEATEETAEETEAETEEAEATEAEETAEETEEEDEEEEEVERVSRATLAITGQPVNYTGDIGDTAKFTVTATGTGLTYQWQYMTPTSTAWQNSTASAAKTKNMTVAITAARDGQKYRVIVTDASGNKVYSNAVKVMVAWTKFTTQPKDYVGTVGNTAYFDLVTDNKDVKYQWMYRDPNSTTWANSYLTGYNTAHFRPTITVGRHGFKYRCKVTDADGHENYSDTVTLYCKAYVKTQPTDQVAKAGSNVVFTVAGTGRSLTYQWQYRTSSSGTWKNSTMTGYNTKSMTVAVTAARNGYQYRCVLKDSYGNTAESNAATLKLPIYFTTQPTSYTGVVGDTAKFTVAATSGLGVTLKYQWQYAKAGSSTWTNSSASSATTKTLSVEVTSARHGQQYRCVVTDTKGNSETSNVVTINVPIVIDTQPVKATAYVGDTAKFRAEATSNIGSTLSYQWQYKSKTMSDYANSSFESATWKTLWVPVTAARAGYYYRCVISDKKGNKVITDGVKLYVPIIITTQPKDSTDGVFTVKADGNSVKYLWYWAAPGSTSFKACTSATTGYNSTTLKVVPTADRAGRQFYCVITDAFGNSTKSNTVTLKAAPITITAQPTDQSAFPGESVTFTVTATSSSTLTYQWQWRKGATGTWANSTGTGNKTASLPIEVTTARNGYQYQCIITDASGNKVTTDTATLTASDTFTLNYVTYQLVSGNLTVIGYTSTTKTSYTIPETAKGYTVTKIGESAFEGNTKIKSIDLPDTITVIGKRAFANCTALTTMN